MNSHRESQYFPSLTGVRAVAAFMVFATHYNPFQEEIYGLGIHAYVHKFYVGVSLFFVLSGFLIAYRYYDKSNFKYKDYLFNRFVRIYPLFFLITTFSLLLRSVFQHFESTAHFFTVYLMNITFLKGFFSDFFFTGLMQGWSLTVEETFYIAAPFFFLLIKKTKLSFLFAPVLLMGTGLVLVSFFSKVDFYGFFDSNRLMFRGTFFGRCLEFFGGIFLALIIKQKRASKSYFPFTYLGVVFIAICIYLIPVKTKDTYHDVGVWDIVSGYLLMTISIVIFLYGLITEKSVISKILSSRLFVLLGKSSYAFYLIHMGYFVALIKLFTDNYMVIFLFVNIAAILLYFFAEEPIRRYLLRLRAN